MTLSSYRKTVTNDAGDLVTSVTVTVRRETDAVQPQLYSDRSGLPGAVLGNSYVSSTGKVFFFVEPGEYRIDYVSGSFTDTERYVAIGQGERYDLPFSTTGGVGGSEILPGIPIIIPLSIPAGLVQSIALCEVAPTGIFIITFKKKDLSNVVTTLFTATFAAGSRIGTFTMAADATLDVGDILYPVAPVAFDATFEGFSATIATLRTA